MNPPSQQNIDTEIHTPNKSQIESLWLEEEGGREQPVVLHSSSKVKNSKRTRRSPRKECRTVPEPFIEPDRRNGFRAEKRLNLIAQSYVETLYSRKRDRLHRELERKALKRMGIHQQGGLVEFLTEDTESRKLVIDLALFGLSVCTFKHVRDVIPSLGMLINRYVPFPSVGDVMVKLKAMTGVGYEQSNSLDFIPANGIKIGAWWRQAQGSAFWQHMHKLYVYVASIIIHGMDCCDQVKIEKIASECRLTKLINKCDFLATMVNTIQFVCTKLIQSIKMGSWTPLFHSESTYENWYNNSMELLRDEMRLSDHDFDRHGWMKRLLDAKTEGDLILKAAREYGNNKAAIRYINDMLRKIQMCYYKHVTQRGANEMREVPFCILVCGSSSIGKSTFVDINRHYYGSLQGLDTSIPSYFRNPGNEYWDAFESHMWSVVLDDVACFKPAQVMGVDDSVKEIIQIINNQPLLPNRASLDDKARTPVLAKLVQMTTNVVDLHAPIYFESVAAVFRRCQHRVVIEPKPEYRNSAGLLDSLKASRARDTHGYDDLWEITVQKAIVKKDRDYNMDDPATWAKEVCTFETIVENGAALHRVDMQRYLEWLRDAIRNHEECQSAMLRAHSMTNDVQLCTEHHLPYGNHVCEQAGRTDWESLLVLREYEIRQPEGEVNPDDDWSFWDSFHAFLYYYGKSKHYVSGARHPPLRVYGLRSVCDFIPETVTGMARYSLARWQGFSNGFRRTHKIEPEMWFITAVIMMFALKVSKSTMEIRQKGFCGNWLAANQNAFWHFWAATSSILSLAVPFVLGANGLIAICLQSTLTHVICRPLLYGEKFALLSGCDLQLNHALHELCRGAYMYSAYKLGRKLDIIRGCGEYVCERLGCSPVVLAILAALPVVGLLFFILRVGSPEEQGNVESYGVTLEPGKEKESVWKRDEYEIDTFDFPRHSLSLKGSSSEEIANFYSRNLAYAKFDHGNNEGRECNIFFLGNGFALVNTHCLPTPDNFRCRIVLKRLELGISLNFETIISQHDVQAVNDDLSIIQVRATTPKRHMLDSLASPELQKYDGPGFRLKRDSLGELKIYPLKRVWFEMNPQLRKNVWTYVGDHTIMGDCGSLIFISTPSGPVLVAIHNWLMSSLLNTSMCGIDLTGNYFDLKDRVFPSQPMLHKGVEKVGELGALHPKSPLRWIEQGNMQCFGSFTGFRSAPKSRVTDNLFRKDLEDLGYECGYGAPVMKGYEVKQNHLRVFSQVNSSIPSRYVNIARKSLLRYCLKQIPTYDVDMFSVHTAINGAAGVKFIDRLRVKTSAGFPWKQSKKNFLTPKDGDWANELTLDEAIVDDIQIILDHYESGEQAHPIFTASLKDEPRKTSKILQKNTRVFFGGPMGFIIVQRMLYLWFVRLVQSFPRVFMQAPGLNAQSVQWHDLYMWLAEYSETTCIAGDYKNFDITQDVNVQMGVYEFIESLAIAYGADAKHIELMKVAKYDLVYPMVDFFGDLVQVIGKNPSGQCLTVLTNGFSNVFYMMIVFMKEHPDFDEMKTDDELEVIADKYFEHVRSVFYGDDNVLAVRGAEWFNHTAIARQLASHNITYTMAEKERESVPFIPLSECTFLKRSWRFDDEMGHYMGALDESSIVKALMIHIPSSFVSKEVQAIDCLRTQNTEMFFHGREVFRKWHARFNDFIIKHELLDFLKYPLEDYEELKVRYEETVESAEEQANAVPMDCNRCGLNCSFQRYRDAEDLSYCAACGACCIDEMDLDCFLCEWNDFCPSCFSERIMLSRTPFWEGYVLDWKCSNCNERSCVFMTRVGRNATRLPASPVGSQSGIGRNSYWEQSGVVNYSFQRGLRPVSVRGRSPKLMFSHQGWADPKLNQTEEVLGMNSLCNNIPATTMTTADLSAAGKTENEAKEQSQMFVSQTVEFVDASVGEICEYQPIDHYPFGFDDQLGVELGDFLKRPTLLKTYTWTESSFGGASFYPWYEFFSDSVIANKIANFPYFRGNLRVKIMVNCSPFYYGAMLAYYTPLTRDVITNTGTSVDLIRKSQFPHIWIHPQTSTGGEMLLPFFYPQNYLNLTSLADVQRMGSIALTEYDQLTTANSSLSNGCTIQIYAWCEDAILTGATTKAILQAGPVLYDEYGDGPVSAPAAALTKWARYFENIPVIGRFATATRIGSSAVSAIAKLFGWSNVPVIEDVKPIKNVPFHDLASAHISEPTTKFTLDPKAELTVSPDVTGLGPEDELSISSLVQKESYLTSFMWNTTDVASTGYFNMAVTPCAFDRGTPTSAGTYKIGQTPMCWVAQKFHHWRGDIIFRFQVICTKFHQGRLRIAWDPLSDFPNNTAASNVLLTRIVDIAEETDVEFRVPYMQPLPWSDHGSANGYAHANYFGTTGGVISPQLNQTNGVIRVTCLTNLSAPVDTASVRVLVYVRGAENLEFANPTSIPSGVSYFTMQSGNVKYSEESDKRTQPPADFKIDKPFPETYLINWGEPIPSLRLLMRRTEWVDSRDLFDGQTASDKSGEFRLIQPRTPPSPGYCGYSSASGKANGVEVTGSTFPFNYSNMTTVGWFAPGFIAHRGSIRWHYNVVGQVDPSSSISVTRATHGTADNQISYVTRVTSSDANDKMVAARNWLNASPDSRGASGMALTNGYTQTGVSAEMPMMTNYRFQSTNPEYWTAGFSYDGSLYDTYRVSIRLNPTLENGKTYHRQLDRYVSIGTDFNLHFFLSVPPVYYNVNQGASPVAS